MGMFSWLTADTQETIANIHSGHPNAGRPVYLLRPDGKPPVCEPAYEGYGFFNRACAYKWLARNNTRFNSHHIGVLLAHGDVARDRHGVYYMYGNDADEQALLREALNEDVAVVSYNSGDDMIVIDGEKKTYNDWVTDGGLMEITYRELVGIKYPLKFSFDKHAQYDALPESRNCPNQGMFY